MRLKSSSAAAVAGGVVEGGEMGAQSSPKPSSERARHPGLCSTPDFARRKFSWLKRRTGGGEEMGLQGKKSLEKMYE